MRGRKDLKTWLVMSVLLVSMLSGKQVLADVLIAWGSDSYGLLDVPDGNDFVAIAAGRYHSLALRSNGTLTAWGYNYYGQCDVPDGNDFVDIAGGENHSLALRSDGTLAAWGYIYYYGQCDVPDGNDFVAIAAWFRHSLALRSNGTLVAWGDNSYGQCDVPEGNDFVTIAAGETHNLALRPSGTLVAWGDNSYGQCNVPEGNDFVAIAAGERFSLGLRSDGSLTAWGWNYFGQLDIPDGNDFVTIACGEDHSLALRSDGSLAAWGYDYHGQCDVPLGNDFTNICAGFSHSVATFKGRAPEIVYVDRSAAGVGDGSSWNNAFIHLQDALAFSRYGDEIRVAQGTYRPDQGVNQTLGDCRATFQLRNGVTVKGGYAGLTEQDPTARDIEQYETTLSGDLSSDGAHAFPDSFHVVTAGSSADANTILDGFTVSGGVAEWSLENMEGGGVLISGGSPTIKNCIFSYNRAYNGGAIAIKAGNPKIINCLFVNNSAFGHFLWQHTTIVMGEGGALRSRGDATIINCIFAANSANTGGAAYIWGGNHTFENCTFVNNQAIPYHFIDYYGQPVTRPGSVGGLFIYGYFNPDITIKNCIFWDNLEHSSLDESAQICGNPAINYCCIQGWTGALGGTGNIGDDPLFADPNNGDYHLKSQAGRCGPVSRQWVMDDVTSPCIDTGDPLSPIGYEPFPNGGRINMGAYGGTAEASKSNGFPFEIKGSMFVRKSDAKPVFLNIICYQPLGPGQWLDGEIRAERVRDDLRRWRAYQGGLDPVVLRVYPQPTPAYPMRLSKAFYDGVRELGFWIIRDIYFDQNFCNPKYIENGHRVIDAVIAEVNDANALDLIFAWEIGNEFQYNETPCWNADTIKQFIENMCSYLKAEIVKLDANGVSNWVTWASYPPYDPLFTDGNPLMPNGLDYISYNAYSYHPERLRDHQAGPVTGTPYQGYLAALKKCYPDKPLVISETGLSDSVISHQDMLRPWYPIYRYGGMSPEQVAEGMADRYWDARLLRDDKDPNIVIAGLSIFEWNDEWWKGGTPGVDDQLPEEHFGLGRFEERLGGGRYQLRYKFQQETIRDLYTLTFDHNAPIIEDLIADNNSVLVGECTLVHTVVSHSAAEPVRYRWETNRGYIIGDSNTVEFYGGNNFLGPASVTVIAIDANSNASVASTLINIETSEPSRIEILTLGTEKASGWVHNVGLDEYKLIVYIKTNKLYAQPYQDQYSPTGVGMKSIWIDKQGYWWTNVSNNYDGELYCWLVPKEFDPPDEKELGWTPPGSIAFAKMVDANDNDNDLLPDYWERQYFDNTNRYDRYDDPDRDMGNNLEEFLREMDPNDPNDNDGDGLWDHWEYHYFGDVTLYDANNDPDGDGLTNLQEHDPNLGTHPGRASQDKDQDRLPDLWEIRWFNNLAQNTADNADFDGCTNLDEYEVGLNPVFPDLPGDFDCDCEVNWPDLALFARQWLSPRLPANIAPEIPDRTVNFLDLKVFGGAWLSTSPPPSPGWTAECDIYPDGKIDLYDFAVFAEQWLHYYYADIAPDEGDGVVNFLDFAVLANNWLARL